VSDTVDTDKMVRKLYESGWGIPEDALLYSSDYSINIQKVSAAFANHYCHAYTIEAVVYNEGDRISEGDLVKLENVVTEWIRQTCNETYSKLETYYEELVTDDAILETIRDNKWMFTETGLNAQSIVNNF